MKRILTALLLCFLVTGLSAQKKITFVPQWIPQAQFAGYYVALEKGFYANEGLDVTIRHTGLNSTETGIDLISNGQAQITGRQLVQSIVSRSDGKKIVNVLQLTQNTGLMVVSHTPVESFEVLTGKKVGRWRAGFSEICEIIENKIGMAIKWVPFVNGINLFVFKAVDATLCYSYSEYVNLLLALGHIPEENVIRFKDSELNFPEDGLYVTEKYYKKNKDAVDAFVRASIKGWEYTRGHIEEALEITRKYTEAAHVVTNYACQKIMLEEYLKLQVNPDTGIADYKSVSQEKFDKIISILMETGFIYNKVDYKDMIR